MSILDRTPMLSRDMWLVVMALALSACGRKSSDTQASAVGTHATSTVADSGPPLEQEVNLLRTADVRVAVSSVNDERGRGQFMLAPGDTSLMEALLVTFGEAFNDLDTHTKRRPSADYLSRLLSGDSFIALAALKGSEVALGIAASSLGSLRASVPR